MSAIDLLEALKQSSTSPLDHSTLSSAVELEQVVAFSLLHCAGVERIFTDQSVFDGIVNTASTLSHSVSD